MALAAYERRHGWKSQPRQRSIRRSDARQLRASGLGENPRLNGYMHALVTAVTPAFGDAKFGRYHATLTPAGRGLDPAQAALGNPFKPRRHCLREGDVSSPQRMAPRKVALEQDSGAQGALVAIDNATGEIKAMVGGRDFNDLEIQSRHTGPAPGRIFVQALRLHRRHRPAAPRPTTRSSTRPSRFQPPGLRSYDRRTITTKSLKATLPCGARWPSHAIFRR